MEWIPIYLACCMLVYELCFIVWLVVGTWSSSKTTQKLLLHEEEEQQQIVEENHLHGSGSKDDERRTHAVASSTTSNPVMLSWRGMTCTYASPGKGAEPKTTLKNAHGVMRGGELTAVMGASGAGKSTLLDTISGRKALGKITGEMSILGEHVTDLTKALTRLKNIAAYVPQFESFFPMQTPKEAVEFRAKLVHGKDGVSEAEIIHALKEVGLGDPNLYSRSIGGELAGGVVITGLSGGEKKRLALACALIARPSFLMLDEITSGLDSENALATMQLVKQVCIDASVSALVVIHQPNGYIWDTFDRLILLANGHCVFSDQVNPSTKLASFYETRLGATMPFSSHELPLDLLMRLSQPLDWDSIGAYVELVPSRRIENRLRTTAVPNLWKLGVVFDRNLVNHYVRNPTNLLARIFIYAACSLVQGAIFWKIGEKDSPQSVVGGFVFTLMLCYLLPFAMIATFVHDKKFFLAERSLGLYPPWAHGVSQLLLELFALILAGSVQAAIMIPMLALWNEDLPDWASFLTLFCVIVMSGIMGCSIILFFCIIVASQDVAFVLGAGFVSICLCLSGGFIPGDEMSDSIQWLQWFSPVMYSLQALAAAFYGGTDKEGIIEFLDLDHPETVSRNIGALGLIYTIFSLGTVLVLTRTQEKR